MELVKFKCQNSRCKIQDHLGILNGIAQTNSLGTIQVDLSLM